MTNNGPPFTMGVEEEYLLVDKQTRALVIDPPQSLVGEFEEVLGEQVSSELLRSQVEIGTKVCVNAQEVREELVRLRGAVIEVAGRHGLAPIAASTHPFVSGAWLSGNPRAPQARRCPTTATTATAAMARRRAAG